MYNIQLLSNELIRISHLITAKSAEKEVERFLKEVLSKSKWRNKAFAVGG